MKLFKTCIQFQIVRNSSILLYPVFNSPACGEILEQFARSLTLFKFVFCVFCVCVCAASFLVNKRFIYKARDVNGFFFCDPTRPNFSPDRAIISKIVTRPVPTGSTCDDAKTFKNNNNNNNIQISKAP